MLSLKTGGLFFGLTLLLCLAFLSFPFLTLLPLLLFLLGLESGFFSFALLPLLFFLLGLKTGGFLLSLALLFGFALEAFLLLLLGL